MVRPPRGRRVATSPLEEPIPPSFAGPSAMSSELRRIWAPPRGRAGRADRDCSGSFSTPTRCRSRRRHNEAENDAEKAKMCQKVHHLISAFRSIWAMRGIGFDTDDRGSVRNTRGDLNRLHRYYCRDKNPKNQKKTTNANIDPRTTAPPPPAPPREHAWACHDP